jgi:hypothetical protein
MGGPLRPRDRGILKFMGDDPRSHDSRPPSEVQPAQDADLDAISRAVGAKPLGSLDELALDVWESDEELDAFLADLRASRESGLA